MFHLAQWPQRWTPPQLCWCFAPLHNLLRAFSCTSCSCGAGESSAVWFNTSVRRASDLAQQQKATHVTNAIRGKYAITAIPTLSCGQTRTICQWGPSGISSARIGTCRYHCPCLPSAERLACGVGCPDAPGRPGRGRCMAGVKKQGSIIKSKALSLTVCVTCPLSLLKHREAMFNCCWQESGIVRSRRRAREQFFSSGFHYNSNKDNMIGTLRLGF